MSVTGMLKWATPVIATILVLRCWGYGGCVERTAATIWSGLIGVALSSTAKGARASQTALAIAAGGATAPPSPTPLTPSGLSGEGECWWIIIRSGTSVAVGTM